MTLGEFEYEETFILPDTKLRYPVAANIVFVLFALAMPIILMNMLVWYGFNKLLQAAGISDDNTRGWTIVRKMNWVGMEAKLYFPQNIKW